MVGMAGLTRRRPGGSIESSRAPTRTTRWPVDPSRATTAIDSDLPSVDCSGKPVAADRVGLPRRLPASDRRRLRRPGRRRPSTRSSSSATRSRFNWGTAHRPPAPGTAVFQADFAPLRRRQLRDLSATPRRTSSTGSGRRPRRQAQGRRGDDRGQRPDRGRDPWQAATGVASVVETIQADVAAARTILLLGRPAHATIAPLNPEIERVDSLISGPRRASPGVAYLDPRHPSSAPTTPPGPGS